MSKNVIDITPRLRRNQDPLENLRIGLVDEGRVVSDVAFNIMLDKLTEDDDMIGCPFTIMADSQEYVVWKSSLYANENGNGEYTLSNCDINSANVDGPLENPFDKVMGDESTEDVIANTFDYVRCFYEEYLYQHIGRSDSVREVRQTLEKLQKFTDSFDKIIRQVAVDQKYRFRIVRNKTEENEIPVPGLLIESDNRSVISLTPSL